MDFDLVKQGFDKAETKYEASQDKCLEPIEWHKQKYFIGTTMKSPLIKVDNHLRSILVLSFKHLDDTESYDVYLMEGSRTLWEVQYMKNGELQGLLGRVFKIVRYESTDFTTCAKASYKITFDTSSAFSGKKVTVDANNIRLIKLSEYDDSEYPIHPEEKPGVPIVVPPDAFNFIKKTYPARHSAFTTLPNPLIMNHVVNGLSMFEGCVALEEIDPMYTRDLKIMDTMFVNNISLRFIPKIMTKNVTSMIGTFSGCESVEFMYKLETYNVTKMDQMFQNCKKLRSIPALSMYLVTSATDMFKGCEQLEEVSFDACSVRIPLDFTDCKLTKECVLNIIRNLGTPRDETQNTIKFAKVPESGEPKDYKYKFTENEWNNIVKPAIEEKKWAFVGIIQYTEP